MRSPIAGAVRAHPIAPTHDVGVDASHLLSYARETPSQPTFEEIFFQSVGPVGRTTPGAGRDTVRVGTLLDRQRVPDVHGGITRARGELRPVGAEDDGVHVVGVAPQLDDLLVRAQVPQTDRVVLAADRQAVRSGLNAIP